MDGGLAPGADVQEQAAALRRGAHEGVDDVVDEDVVARGLAVAEDLARLTGQQPRREDRHDARLAVRVLPRPVHVRESERRELDLVQLAVGDEVVVARLLRHAIRRQRMLRVRLLDGQVARVDVAVDRAAARGVDDLAAAGGTGRFEDVQRAHRVHGGVEQRIGDRDADARLRGEVEHDLGLLAFGEGDQLGGTDVEVVDREGVAAGAPGLGEVRELAGEKVVDDVDAVPFGEQAIDEVRTDEARLRR